MTSAKQCFFSPNTCFLWRLITFEPKRIVKFCLQNLMTNLTRRQCTKFLSLWHRQNSWKNYYIYMKIGTHSHYHYEFQTNDEKLGDEIIFDDVSKKNRIKKCQFFVKTRAFFKRW